MLNFQLMDGAGKVLIGNVPISPNLVLAPMAGVTDSSFRRLIKELGGVGLIVTEFISVEGLTRGTVLHPVQEAFCETDGLMCGFCTPGFVVAAVALLEQNPNPTPEQAKRALDGNICRCGTYSRVLEATLKIKAVPRG